MQNILFLTVILTSPLFAERYGSYDLSLTHGASAGMAGLGVGLNEPGSSLYNNPAFLASSSKVVIDAGINFSANQNKTSSVKPISFGFYIPLDAKQGWGITGKQSFFQNFPGGYDSMSAHTYSFFWSYKFSENWNGSFGIGPSTVFRGGYQSNFSLSPSASLSYKNANHVFGISFLSPGKFRLEGYRGVDSLKERLPEYAAIGYSYQLGQILIYSEARKIFWEKSSFILNNTNSKPNLDRGLGAEIKLSSGIQYSLKDSHIQLRTGLETGGFYDEKGMNRRAAGLAIGLSWNVFQSKEEDTVQLHFAILNYSIFSHKGGRLPESLFYFSAGYLF